MFNNYANATLEINKHLRAYPLQDIKNFNIQIVKEQYQNEKL